MNRRLYQGVALPLILLSAQPSPAEIAPAIPTLAKIYDKAPDGLELYELNYVALDPTTGALWVKYGSKNETPVRFDRKAGTSRVIGRLGSGPNEFPRPESIFGIAPGANGEVVMWDLARLAVVWINAAGVQTRQWPVRTSASMMGRIYTDTRGRAYVGQPGSVTATNLPRTAVAVRVDSSGFRDTLRLPLSASFKYSWICVNNGGGGVRGSAQFLASHAPRLEWGVDRQGRAFAAWSDSNFVAVSDGPRIRRLVFPNAPVPLTAAERKTVSDDLDGIAGTCSRQQGNFEGPRPPVPDVRPQITTLVAEVNGGIAVVRDVACARVPTWRAPETSASPPPTQTLCPIVERFDASGARLRPFTLTPGDRLMALRADTAWVRRTGSDGLSSIRELRIPPR
jgi:hypothetical protein